MKIIMEDEKVERVRQIGRNLAEAAADYEKAEWKGDKGIFASQYEAKDEIKK